MDVYIEALTLSSYDEAKQIIFMCNDLNQSDSRGRIPLFQAIRQSRLDIAELLIDSGADVNTVDSIGYTPLHVACELGDYDAVKLLVDHGANVNQIDFKWQASPFLFAIYWGHDKIQRYLSSRSAECLKSKALFGYSAIHLACFNCNINIVKGLIDKQVDINDQADNGVTPLLLAVMNKSMNLISLLIQCGADVNIQDNRGEWPVFIASRLGCLDVVKLLTDHKSDLEKRTVYRETVLHAACIGNVVSVLQLLLGKVSNLVNAQRKDKNTPLHIATEKGNLRMIKILIRNGAERSLRLRNRQNETPIDIAHKGKITRIINYLETCKEPSIHTDFDQRYINKAMNILKTQFTFVAGLQPLNVCETDRDCFSPRHQKFVQIMNEGDRFSLASTIGMPNGHVEYYDVLNTTTLTRISPSAINRLADLTVSFNETSRLVIHCPQFEHEFSVHDSGVVCLAIAIGLLHTGCCPDETTLKDSEQLRSCIKKAIKMKKFVYCKINKNCKKSCKGSFKALVQIYSPSAFYHQKIEVVHLHCICRKPYEYDMRECEKCHRYVHPSCVALFLPGTPQSTESDSTLTYCPDCLPLTFSFDSVFRNCMQIYDAFVSYSYSDFSFVKKQLLVNLENSSNPGYRYDLMIHHRNIMPGAVIPDAIIDAISACRKYIIILSKNYLLGQWNSFEWSNLCLRKFKDIIIILMEPYSDITSYDLPPTLRNFVENGYVLEWNDDFKTEERVRFWETLVQFLHPPLKYSKMLHVVGQKMSFSKA